MSRGNHHRRIANRATASAQAIAFSAMLVLGTAAMAQGQPANTPPANTASSMTQQLRLGAMPAASRVEAGGREVVLIFPASVSPADVATLERAAGTGLIEGVSIGQDAVRLRLSRPGLAQLEAEGRGAVLRVLPAGRGGASWPERRLALAEAETALRTGDTAAARATIAPMLAEAPRDTALIERMAAIEAASGRSRSALALYERALGLDPGASSLVAARRSLAAQQGPFLRSEAFGIAAPGGQRIASYQLSAGMPFSDGWRVDIRSEFRRGSARNLRQSGRDAGGSFSGEGVRGEAGIERRWERAGTTRLAVLGGPRMAGASIQQTFRLGAVDLAASFDYNRPYWDTMMSFAGNAVRDQAILGSSFRLGEHIVVQAGGGYVRYGVPGVSNVAQGPAFAVAVNWTAPERWMLVDGWQFRAGYRFTGEYLSSIANGRTPSGQLLPLLDVRSREVHGVEAALEGPVGPAQLTLLGGYAIDRYGGSGPLGLIRVGNRREGRFAYGLEASVGPSLAENARAVWRLGGFLAWRPGA